MINRALVYGLLTAVLTLTYLLLVILLEAAIREITGGSSQVAVVISTLLIASLFNPVRHRIQDWIDRHFYRHKYDAQKTLEAFSANLRNQVELETLLTNILRVVDETIQPEHANLWIKPSRNTFRND